MSDRGAVSRVDTPATNRADNDPGAGKPSAHRQRGFVWVTDPSLGAGTVAQMDPRTNGGQVVGKPIASGTAQIGIDSGLGTVWVAN